MNSARLASMLTDAVSFDVECHKFQPGLLAPPVVCASVARVVDGKIVGQLLDRQTAIDTLLTLLKDERITIVNLNVAIDMLLIAVDASRTRGLDILPYIFNAYASGRVYDPALAEALHHIGLGCLGRDPRTGRKFSDKGYSLEIVHELVTGQTNAKVNDRWRTSYQLLENIPIGQWRTVAGDEAVDYPIDDARNALHDALAQAGLMPNVGKHEFDDGAACIRCREPLMAGLNPQCSAKTQRLNLHDLATQTYTAFCMKLSDAHGLTPDPIAVARLKLKVTKDWPEDVQPFRAAGIVRDDDTENQSVLKRLVAAAYGCTERCPACVDQFITKGRKNAKYQEALPAGRVINPDTGRPINCEACDGTGLTLSSSVPRSDGGGIAKGRDVLNESGDEFLMAYAEFGELDKIRETYIPWMETAIDPQFRLYEMTDEALQWLIDRIDSARWAGQRVVTSITLASNVLLETNRVSFRDKSQTLPRKGGVRNCFVPDDGFGYYSCDYTGIELAAWAQICLWMFGKSDMAVALNSGINAHGKLGAQMCGMPYDDFMRLYKTGSQREKDFRQGAKWGNFGLMGGAGAIRLVIQVREQGEDTPHPSGPIVKDDGLRYYKGTRFCLLIGGAERCGITMLRKDKRGQEIAGVCAKCVECAEWIRDTWFETWGEAKPFFAKVTEISNRGFQTHPTSKRRRGGIGFCDGANGFFQELAACGGKAGMRGVVREQYDASYLPPDADSMYALPGINHNAHAQFCLPDRSILLNNSRNIIFLHDENLGIGRLEVLPEVAERVCAIMKREMIVHIPDVKIEVEPTITDRWYKEAAMVRDANGRLVIWQPKRK